MKIIEVKTEDFYKFMTDRGVHYAISNLGQTLYKVYVEDDYVCQYDFSESNFDPFNQDISNIKEFKVPDGVHPSEVLTWFTRMQSHFLVYNNILKTIVVYSEYLQIHEANLEEVKTLEVLREYDYDCSIQSFISTEKYLCWYMLENVSYVKIMKKDYDFFLTFDIFHELVQPKTVTFSCQAYQRTVFDFDHIATARTLARFKYPAFILITPGTLAFSHE